MEFDKLSSGTITSPLWPNFYPPDIDEDWEIQVKEHMEIIHFDIVEFDVACPDRVAMFDGGCDSCDDQMIFNGCGT